YSCAHFGDASPCQMLVLGIMLDGETNLFKLLAWMRAVDCL
ncbi:MAG: hypothetical protein ACI8TF_003239, partial [Paracoccaceae bacterium]